MIESNTCTCDEKYDSLNLSKKHGKIFLEILTQDRMIPNFYNILYEKMNLMENGVRDIIKYVETEANAKFQTLPDSLKRKLVNQYLISVLNRSHGKGVTKLSRIYHFSDHELETMIPDNFSVIDSFTVIGCPESTDIDVVCYAREQDNYMGFPRRCQSKEFNI